MPFIIKIYLMNGVGTKVHVVFFSEHLMKRYQQEFADILYFIDDADTKLEYHVGIDIEAKEGDLILIDEAEIYMLDNPEKVRKFTSANVCIGFTATPAMIKMETTVEEQLNFKQYSYSIGETTIDTFEKIAMNSVIDAPNNIAKTSYIADIAKLNPMLVFSNE